MPQPYLHTGKARVRRRPDAARGYVWEAAKPGETYWWREGLSFSHWSLAMAYATSGLGAL